MKKRFLSVLLALNLVLTMLPVNALAAEWKNFTGQGAEAKPDSMEAEVSMPAVLVNAGPHDLCTEESSETSFVESAPETGLPDVELYANTVTYDLENGAALTFDPSSGTVTKCVPGEATEIVIPDVIEDVDVTSIGSRAFSGCSKLTSVTIPDRVTSIGERVFDRCTALESVTIPDSVTSIGAYAFYGCSGLTSVTIPGSVANIESFAFDNCSKLASVTILDGVTSIGEGAFCNCDNLTTVNIPDSVTFIGESAFSACKSLTTVNIPDGVTSIGSFTFNNCHSLTTITIPDSVTSIGWAAFYYCWNLTSITIPNSVTSIGDSAFDNCKSLTSVTLSDKITSIGSQTFYGCSSLTSITIPDSVANINSFAFGYCSALTSVTIPSSVTSIGTSAFGNCPKVTISCFPESYAETYAKNRNIPYEHISSGRTLTVSVLDQDGDPIMEGFTVAWYNAAGNFLGTNSKLYGSNEAESYEFEIHLGEELAEIYEQPTRQTIAPEDDAACEVRLTHKVEIPTLTLTGCILDKDNQPVSGAEVSFTPVDGNPATAMTGEDGKFSVDVPCAAAQVTIRKDGYYTKQQFLDLSGETGTAYQMDDIILTEIVVLSDRITLTITQKQSGEDPEQAAEVPVVSVKRLEFTLTDAGGNSITNYEVQGTTLIFGAGAVSPNETITVTVEDPVGIYVGATATVTLDGSCLGSAELVMIEKGRFLLEGLSGPEATLLIFDSSGKCVKTAAAQSGMSSGPLSAGDYKAVLLQKADLLRSVPRISYLATLGLQAGKDYLLRDVTISDGRIVRLADCAVPTLSESRISYTVAEGTFVTTNKPSGAAAGELILLRVAYELDPSKDVSANSLNIVLPDGISLMNFHATLNGVNATYIYNSDNREAWISVAGKSKGTVYVYCTATASGSQTISAYLTLSSGAVQTIGSTVVPVENARIAVPEKVGKAEGLIASGKTIPKSKVTLYDNDTVVGTTTSNAVGSWSMEFDLVQPVYTYSYHFVYAVTESAEFPQPVVTDEMMITYHAQSAGQLTKITMYNTAHSAQNLNPLEQETVFDFTDSQSTTVPYYRIWPSRYPTFTFKVEFAGDASELSEVYVVTTNSAGNETYVETTYDAASNAWVGTHDYKNFYDAPAAVGASYGSEYDPLYALSVYRALRSPGNYEFFAGDDDSINCRLNYYGDEYVYKLSFSLFNTQEDRISFVSANFDEKLFDEEGTSIYYRNGVSGGDEGEQYCFITPNHASQEGGSDPISYAAIIIESLAETHNTQASKNKAKDSIQLFSGCGCMDGLRSSTTPGAMEYNAQERLNNCSCVGAYTPAIQAQVDKMRAIGGIVRIVPIGLVANEVLGIATGSNLVDTSVSLIKKWFDDLSLTMPPADKAFGSLVDASNNLSRNFETMMKTFGCRCSNPSSDSGNTPHGEGNQPVEAVSLPVRAIHDPSGYVYEAVPSNRLEGVTAIISCEADSGAAWNAANYDQINPQITGADGSYYWDVPQGNWKVNFSKEGYEPTDTSKVTAAVDGWLPVPPPQLEINVGMISNAAPTLEQANAYTDRVELVFSQYMDLETTANAVTLTRNGNPVEATVTPLNAEYNLEETFQYASRFAVTPVDGNMNGALVVSVAGSAKNYAGTLLAEAYASPVLSVFERPTSIDAPDKVSVVLHKATDISIVLRPGIADRKLVVENLNPALVTINSNEFTTGADGSTNISLTGNLPGSGTIRITDPMSGLSKNIDVQIGDAQKVDPSDGRGIISISKRNENVFVSIDTAKDGVLLCAVYNANHRFLGVASQEISAAPGIVEYAFSDLPLENAAYAKAYLLNNLNDCIPLCPTLSENLR